MTRRIGLVGLLVALRVAACQEPPIRDLNVLIGKQVIVQRPVLCPPGTFTWSLAYAGKQATVVSLKPSKRSSQAAAILVRFEDGTQLDSCIPITPSVLSDHFELVPGKNLEVAPAENPVAFSTPGPTSAPASAPDPHPVITPASATAVAPQASNKKDKSDTYQMGSYLGFRNVADGTMTDNFHCGSPSLASTTCSGGMRANGVSVYQIQAADGVWHVETRRQAVDSMMRRTLDTEPMHLRSEKENPLDLLRIGDKVIFRVEKRKKLGGTEPDVLIPFASNPNKEETFVGTFFPSAAPTAQPKPPSDNVKAMCEAHKLSPELEKQLCSQVMKEKR